LLFAADALRDYEYASTATPDQETSLSEGTAVAALDPNIRDEYLKKILNKKRKVSIGSENSLVLKLVLHILKKYNALTGADGILSHLCDYLDHEDNLAKARSGAALTVEIAAGFHRLFIAIFGGVAVLVPMLIMSFSPSRTKSLITVSVFVVWFACTIAMKAKKASDSDLLSATAAYAAVLIVFVGATAIST
jgi:hypothetical protein